MGLKKNLCITNHLISILGIPTKLGKPEPYLEKKEEEGGRRRSGAEKERAQVSSSVFL